MKLVDEFDDSLKQCKHHENHSYSDSSLDPTKMGTQFTTVFLFTVLAGKQQTSFVTFFLFSLFFSSSKHYFQISL